GDRGHHPDAPLPASRGGAAAHLPISLTCWLVVFDASSKIPLNASHIAAPRNAMIITAIAAEITPSPRSSRRWSSSQVRAPERAFWAEAQVRRKVSAEV